MIVPIASLIPLSKTRPDWTLASPRSVGPLYLDKNENVDPVFLKFIDELFLSTGLSGLHQYPDLKATYLALSETFDLPPSHFLLTAGSDGAIRSVFDTFIGPNDRVLLTDPTFAMYPIYAHIKGANIKKITYQRSGNRIELSTDIILENLDQFKPKLFCLPNPDSPTGHAFEDEKIKSIINKCNETQTLLLIDEAYYPFYNSTQLQHTRSCKHVIVAQTFAKAWGIAGLRVGFAAAHPDICEMLHRSRPMYEINTAAAIFLPKLLRYSDQMRASVKSLEAGKYFFTNEMEKLGFQTISGKGNFTHVNFGHKAQTIHRSLEKIVLYRKNTDHPCLDGWSRFSSATIQQFKPVIEAIASSTRGVI